MAKQLNVNLVFKADTTQAKQQLQQLQTQLNNLTTSSISQQLPITPKLQEAQNAAINLKIALQQSMNVDTGKFDLTKFNNSLKRAGTSLNQMRVDLSKFGPEGQQAFMTLAQSIMQAEVPMRRTNALLTQLGTTLKNTAKWQISSMALHGFMSAVSGAYGYAQDLNESLNNIRIVTGKNIDDMKNFANQANKAAKALSTTTTAYTDASLIYYQQGLSDAEVLKRADVTVKMANATGQAAEVVSDQMTAIWNNFYDGSKALEYYSDVVTALGAATASSSDEIAEGLEKFAAVADTVGLSYEYATSALATVTATTRQSADVVGTAFKTLFARIQDLELGKTLDDGTTLGAYAQSLQAVGINIKESNGELKKMDDILSEMGGVWKTLGNDQQAALAQSVAGVRQYTQLMALMENWDYFKDNLKVANDATGTLQEQADIYAESWEAAQKRVQASAQAIYQDLISDEFFIDLQNNFADFLDIIDKAIDGMGGLKGVIALLGGVLLTAFSGQAARGLENMAYNIKMMTVWGQQEIMQTKELAYQEAMRVSNSGYITETQEAQVKVMQTQLLLQNDLVKRANNISEEEKQRCQAIINENKLYGEQLIELTKIKEQISDSKSQQVQSLRVQATQQKAAPLTKEQNQSFGEAQGIIQLGYSAQQTINSINQSFDPKRINDYRASIQDLITQITELKNSGANVQSLESSLKFLQGSLDTLATSGTTKQFQQLIHEMSMDGVASTNSMAGAMQHLHEILGLPERDFQELAQLMLQLAEAENKAQNANNNFKTSVENSRLAIENAKAAVSTWADSLVRIAGGVSSLAFAMQSLSSIGDVFNNEDMTAGEKFLQITMSLSMAIPMLVNGLKALSLVKWKDLGITTASTIVKIANAAATKAQADQEARAARNTDKHTKEKNEQTISEGANTIVKNGNKTSGKTGFFSNIKNSWNQQALKNNPNFQFDEDTGKYLVKDKNVMLNEKSASKLAGKQALSGLGSILGTLGLVAAGIAVAAASITIASNVYNKDAKAAEEASKSAAKAAEMYQNTRAKYEELKSTVSGYQDQIKAISEMTKGTLEWKEAINAANEEALKLIDTYDILDYSVNKETGLIEFGEGAIEAAQAKEFDNMARAQRASLNANVYASETQMKADTTKFNREYASHKGMSDEDWAIVGGAVGGGAGTGAAIGAIVGSIVPVIGNAVGAGVGAAIGAGVGLIGGAIGAAIDNDSEEQEEDAIDKLVEIYDAKGSGMFADSEFSAILDSIGASESLKESLLENKEETQKLIQELHANTESNRLKNQQQMQSYLDSGNNTVYNNSEYQTQIAGILANSKAFDEAKQKAEDKAWKGTDKRIHEAYAEYLGYTKEAGWEIKDTNSGTGKFINKETKEEIELDDKTMVEFLTNEYARQEAAKNVEEVSSLLDSLTNVSGLNDDDMTTAQGAIADFIAGDNGKLLALSDEQMDAVKEQLKNGISLTDEEAQMLGYDNAKAFTEAFDKQLENWSSMSAEQRAEKMAAIEQQEFDSAIASTAQGLGVSSKALEGYTKALQNANPELKDNSEAAIAAAKANINFSKGIVKLDKALKDNYDILHDWNEESFETYEAASKVQEAVKEMFGVDVSANFIKDNLQELQELTKGNTEHLDELREAAAKDFVVNLGLEEGATSALDSALDALINQDREGIKIGAEVDLGSSVDQLNQFLKDGTLTAEQVTQAFNAIGYEPEIGYITDEGGQTTHQTHEVKIGGEKGLTLAKVDTYTTSDVSVPYIKSSTNKDSKGKSNKSSATKTTSTGSIAANLAGLKDKSDREDSTNFKSLNEEIERYHEIKSITNSLSKEMDKLSKAKDRAFGGQKLAYMDAELKVLDAQIAAQDKIIAQAQNYLALDKKNLEQFGVKYNKDGTIANYTDIQTKYLNKLAATDPNSDKYDEINEEYKTFKDYASQYEETWDKVQGEMSKKTDLTFDRLENRLAKIDYKIEIKVEVQDHELNILERQLKRLDDDAYDGASRIKNMTEQTGKAYKKQQINKDGIKDTLKEAGVSDKDIKKYMSGDGEALAKYDLSSSTIEQLEKFTNGFIEAQEQMEKLAQSIKDEVMVTFDAWHEKIDDVGAAIEHQGNVIKSYQNIVDIVGKDRLGIDDKVLKQMEAINNQTAQAQLNNAKVQKETTESALKTAQEKKSLYKKGTEEYEYWASQEEKLNKQLMKDTENFMSSWENALTVAYETFAAQNERAIENFSDMLAGANFDSLDDLAEAFDRAAEKSDQYLENYEKTYELSKLNRKIQNDINKSDNPKAKQMLQELQQEITAAQADGVKLSEHDLKILQKKYDLKLAEIALENAQGNKNQVRLQRDSQGNYNYVYTTDKTAVAEAEQKYEDSVYEIQKLNDDYLDDLSKRVIENRQEMIERLAQLDIKDYENADAYYKARDKIIQEHQDKEVFLFGEMQKTIDSNLDIYNTDVARYSNYTNQKMAQDDNWVLDFDETALAICSGYETMEQAQLDFTTGTEEFVANNKSAYDTFEFNVSNAMDLAGTSIDDFAKAVNIAMYGEDGKGGAVGNIKDLEDKTNKYGTTAQKKFGESANKVVEWYKKYGSKLNKGKKQTDLLEESISKLKSKSITIKTSVSGESQVNKLIKSIEKISDEIKKLKDTDFKITANVKIKNQGKITTEEEDKKYKVQEIAASTTGTRYKVNNKWYSLDELNAPNQGHTEKDDEVSIKSWATGDKKAFETISLNDASLDAEDAEDIRIYDEDGNGGSLRYGVIGKNISIEDLKERKIVGYKYNKTLKTNLYKLDKPIWVGGTDSTYWLNQTDLHQLLDQDGWEALYKRYNLQKLDTGGYTGEWGPEGRLAMLHQKEIVLNAHDTENLLTAVSMIREISSQLESNALAMQYAGALANYRTNVTSASDTLQQEVHITAEFPNATNHSEIEEAFRNLTNLASQYANRK